MAHHSHSHPHGHGHDHDHNHDHDAGTHGHHHHGAGGHPVHAPVVVGSLLRWSLAQRLLLAAVLSLALWGVVLAAIR